jgi:FkbM family methyltransferase
VALHQYAGRSHWSLCYSRKSVGRATAQMRKLAGSAGNSGCVRSAIEIYLVFKFRLCWWRPTVHSYDWVITMPRSVAKVAIQGILNRFGYQLVGRQRFDNLIAEIAATKVASWGAIDVLKFVIQDYITSHPKPFFIQIGANDGITDDVFRTYILDHSLEGVLVEPQPGPFARLVQNYQEHSGLRFENAAIGRSDGIAPLYGFTGTLKDLPLDVFTSFSYDQVATVKKNLDIPFRIERYDVPTMTFQTLLSKYGVKKLDILIIDTEGYDFEILKMIDFGVVCPAIIQFEYTHLPPADKVACYKMLVEKISPGTTPQRYNCLSNRAITRLHKPVSLMRSNRRRSWDFSSTGTDSSKGYPASPLRSTGPTSPTSRSPSRRSANVE